MAPSTNCVPQLPVSRRSARLTGATLQQKPSSQRRCRVLRSSLGSRCKVMVTMLLLLLLMTMTIKIKIKIRSIIVMTGVGNGRKARDVGEAVGDGVQHRRVLAAELPEVRHDAHVHAAHTTQQPRRP